MRHRIGFMQGRLVDRVGGKIQAFPAEQWRDEFLAAQRLALGMMEWTLDHDAMEENPFCTSNGQDEILELGTRYGVRVPSLTGDCFMQAPFWKSQGAERTQRLHALDLVIASCARLKVQFIVIPLVDNGKLDNTKQTEVLVKHLLARAKTCERAGIKIVFESDYDPESLREFIALFPEEVFGVNYDIGNSASLGFNPLHEFTAYGSRVMNVHMKDRLIGGTTVPLGTGNAQFDKVMKGLALVSYGGNIILQTARAVDNDHAAVLARYAELTQQLMELYLEP